RRPRWSRSRDRRSGWSAETDWSSWDPRDAQGRERRALAQARELLLAAQIGHEQIAALVVEAEVVRREHAHAQAHLGADRIERGVEGFFGDAEVGDADRERARLAPDEQGERRLDRRDLDRAALRQRVARLQVGARRI